VILGHNGWSVFRFGPSYGVPNPGVQFPLQAVDEWLKQLVPDFSVTGDFTSPPTSCPPFIDAVNPSGGSATSIHLPDIGIFGNDHMMMMDKNNLDVADVLQDWIEEHVER
jgi:hypothetical protein